MVTDGVWGNMDIYCWGLLGVDGCIQVFGGVGTWLLLCVFPLFAYRVHYFLRYKAYPLAIPARRISKGD
jgi:hypothetical protein